MSATTEHSAYTFYFARAAEASGTAASQGRPTFGLVDFLATSQLSSNILQSDRSKPQLPGGMSTSQVSIGAARSALQSDGFYTMRGFLDEQQLTQLRQAAKRSIDLARAGEWPHVRTLPKQFPPWPSDPSNGIWGVQHLLHPDINDSDTYAASYFHEGIIKSVCGLIDCPSDELVMELYNLLIRPDEDFELRWHRDDVKPEATADEERQRLGEPILHAQWNLALYDDSSLIVVPGTHRRARTDRERHAEPYDDRMPGQQVVHLKAGDLMFYNNNILHRAVYDCSVERMTLHGSMGRRAADVNRARNILQHGIGEWAARCDFSNLSNVETANHMKMALLEMGGGSELGYCQPD